MSRMWAGPYNPTGSYKFPSHYGDGTPIHDTDFSNDDWPDDGDGGQRWIYGELEINNMVSPSMSCMGLKLPSNNNVRRVLSIYYKSQTWKWKDKPVVCEGKNENHDSSVIIKARLTYR